MKEAARNDPLSLDRLLQISPFCHAELDSASIFKELETLKRALGGDKLHPTAFPLKKCLKIDII